MSCQHHVVNSTWSTIVTLTRESFATRIPAIPIINPNSRI